MCMPGPIHSSYIISKMLMYLEYCINWLPVKITSCLMKTYGVQGSHVHLGLKSTYIYHFILNLYVDLFLQLCGSSTQSKVKFK